MKKIIKTLFLLFMMFGCSTKEISINNEATIDKKPLFSLSSLSVETGYNHITGEQKLSLLLSEEAKKRARETIYFTKFKKGMLKLKILSVHTEETKKKNGSFLYFFPSFEKGLSARLSYSIAAYSSGGEELKAVTKTVEASAKEQSEASKKELIEKILNEFQLSIFTVSKNELSAFSASR
jgi:hypothetical protein